MAQFFDYSRLIRRDESPAKSPPSDCKLFDDFAIVIQIIMGCIAVSTLLIKRRRERPQRPFQIWSFDVSKQIIGGITVHFLNILVSLLVGMSLQDTGDTNPCVWYFLNIAVDTTIGVGILWLILKGMNKVIGILGFQGMKTGQYGTPPQWTSWAKQTVVFVVGLFLMKCIVLLILKIFPFLFDVGEWLLGWTQSNRYVQVFFVMLVFPLIMNILQFWIVDNILRFNDSESPVKLDRDPFDGEEDEEAFLGGLESEDEDDVHGNKRSIERHSHRTVASQSSANGSVSRRSQDGESDLIKMRHTPPLDKVTDDGS